MVDAGSLLKIAVAIWLKAKARALLRRRAHRCSGGNLERARGLGCRWHACVEREQHLRPLGGREDEMQGVCGAQRDASTESEQHAFGLAVNARRKFGTAELAGGAVALDALVESLWVRCGAITFAGTPGDRGRQFGDGQLGHDQVTPSNQGRLERCAPRRGDVELRQGTAVQIHGTRCDLHGPRSPSPKAAVPSGGCWRENHGGLRTAARILATVERAVRPAGPGR